MADPFLAEIRIVGFMFQPKGWANCDGQLMPISQNTALFSLLGTNYGGNGTSTFGLPRMSGNVAVGQGQGPGLSQYDLGQQGGETSVTLISSEFPAHSHQIKVSNKPGDVGDPSPTTAIGRAGGASPFVPGAPGAGQSTTMAATQFVPVGGTQPHNNMMPFLALRFIIALSGIFPQRN